MTFSHQMVRLFTIEQIYRAFTILKTNPITTDKRLVQHPKLYGIWNVF